MLPNPDAILSGSDKANRGADTFVTASADDVDGDGDGDGATISWCSRDSWLCRWKPLSSPDDAHRLASNVDRRPFWKIVLLRGKVTRSDALSASAPVNGGTSTVTAASLSRSLPIDPRLLRSVVLLSSPRQMPGRSLSVLPYAIDSPETGGRSIGLPLSGACGEACGDARAATTAHKTLVSSRVVC